MKDKKLNNLLSLDTFSEEKVLKKVKPTKRTEVAKDVLMENTGKDVNAEKMKGKDVVAVKDLNNLISFSDFSKNETSTSSKKTKRTDVAKDVLEKKECCKDEKEEKDEKEDNGLTAAQKKLPEALQKSILAKKKKNK